MELVARNNVAICFVVIMLRAFCRARVLSFLSRGVRERGDWNPKGPGKEGAV